MPNFLVIKTTDVTGTAIPATVTVQFGTDATPRRTTPTPNRDNMEIAIPGDQSKAVIFVSAPGVWDAKQGVKFVTASFGALDSPQLDFDGVQEINTKLVTISSRGDQFNHEVHFVLGQLRDATAKVDGVLRASGVTPSQSQNRLGLSLALPSQRIRDIADPILNPAGTGSGLINVTLRQISIPSPNGPIVFVAERQTTPKLVAIVHPGFANPAPGQPIVPLPYHLFFSPTIPNVFGPDYPFGFNYCEFIDRYLILTGADNSSPGKKLALGYQNFVAGPKNILVFPVAQGLVKQDKQMGDLNSQGAVLRLLQEVNYWVQRMRGALVPVQPVGPVALSCFSAGVRFLSTVIRDPKKVPELFDTLLRHVFLFDPWFDGAKGQTEATQFGQALLAWHRGGSSLRGLRVYTQFNVWKPIFDPPFRALPGARVIPGPGGAEEIESSAATLLFAPLPFWSLVNPQLQNDPLASDIMHDEYPRRFLTHAVKVSQFAP